MKRGKLLVLFGILLGLLTTVAVFLVLSGSQETAAVVVVQETPKQTVLVAIQNISQGSPMDPETVELREFEVSQVPAEAIYSMADIAGKLAAQDIAQGQIIRATMLTDKTTIVEKGIHASFLIPPDKVAVPFPLDELSSVAYALQAGDRIDMLISMQFVSVDPALQIREPVVRQRGETEISGEQEPRLVTQLVLQDVTVLKIGHWGSAVPPAAEVPEGGPRDDTATPPPYPTIMTLLVDQQDALVLKFARESGASIDFALRGRESYDLVTTEPVTLDYMMRRFSITPPQNLPYATESTASATAKSK